MNNENRKFDEILESIRTDEPAADQMEQAAARVRQSLFGAGSADISRITGCADYRSLFTAHINKTLSDARRMLVDDHIRECGGCRAASLERYCSRAACRQAPGVKPNCRVKTRVMWLWSAKPACAAASASATPCRIKPRARSARSCSSHAWGVTP